MEDLLDPDVFIGTADSFLSDDAAISPQPQPDFNTNLLSPPKKSNKRSSSTQIKTENASEDGSPAKKSKSANGTPRKVPKATEGRQVLVDMKEAGAKGKEIEEMWERETGDVGKKAKSLHTRYMRIKDSIACVKPEDHAKLHEARTAAMDDVEQQKKALDAKLWMIIAEKMKGLGASEDYSAGLLEKQYKKLVAAPTAATPPEDEGMEIKA